MKRKYVDEWEPTEEDEKWLIEMVDKLRVGGLWHFPAAGATFEKVGADHLKLKSIQTDDPLNAMIEIEKTKKVGKRAGIKIDTEKAADYIIFYL
jgi:hypothetical protein